MIDEDFKITSEFYGLLGFEIKNLKKNTESIEYDACSFQLNSNNIEYRMSKITPTKIGQFVTIWKRNKEKITTPFDNTDVTDFVIITSKNEDKFGQFIFPKSVLVRQNIFSENGKGGKRGFRIYPPWDITNNKQAEKSQKWQLLYFFDLKNREQTYLEKVKNIFNNS